MIDFSGRLSADDYEVRTVDFRVMRDLVCEHHYAKGGSNTAIYRHGLFRRGSDQCLGAAWWLPPIRQAAKSAWPHAPDRVLSLSRVVVVPDVPKNAASFLVGRSIRRVKQDGRYDLLLTFADSWRGHDGTLYKVTNWVFDGWTAPRPVWVDTEGRMVSYKAGSRPGARERGKGNRNQAEMRALGYTLIGKFPKKRYVMRLRDTRPAELSLAA